MTHMILHKLCIIFYICTESALYNEVKLNAKKKNLCADSTDITEALHHKIAQVNCEEKYD